MGINVEITERLYKGFTKHTFNFKTLSKQEIYKLRFIKVRFTKVALA